MKRTKFLLTILVLCTLVVRGQVPERFKYQSIVRDESGDIISNQEVTLIVKILRGGENGTVICSEIYNLSTNEFGLINLEVGSQDTAAFKSIDWENGPYFLKVELNGSVMGAAELLSVPYALYAKNSGSPIYWMPLNNGIYYNEGIVGIGTSTPDASAQLEISSMNRGFLPPRMTQSDISMIQNPANGLVVFCTTDSKFYAFITESGMWKEILFGEGAILPVDSCGFTLTVNHIEGAVAPVTKTVIYHTVKNIPGETTKCWITSNLGADHQATASDDASEQSAGWLWQYNRIQGFKHDGIIRIPGTAWISMINENSEWLIENDPCAHELGNYWRIPTFTEWQNVITAGDWSDLDDSWNSGLKIHAAGYLTSESGVLLHRGIDATYWSASQYSSLKAWYLYILSNSCEMNYDLKPHALPLRCVISSDNSSE